MSAPKRAALGMLAAMAVAPGWFGATAPAQAQQASVQQEIDAALELYRFRLLQTASRLLPYPQQAIDDRLEGNAAFDIVIAGDGTLKEVKSLASSGHPLLDEHARRLIDTAVPLTQIPSTLQNKAFAIRLAIAFRLPD